MKSQGILFMTEGGHLKKCNLFRLIVQGDLLKKSLLLSDTPIPTRLTAGPGVPQLGHITFVEIGHEIIFTSFSPFC